MNESYYPRVAEVEVVEQQADDLDLRLQEAREAQAMLSELQGKAASLPDLEEQKRLQDQGYRFDRQRKQALDHAASILGVCQDDMEQWRADLIAWLEGAISLMNRLDFVQARLRGSIDKTAAVAQSQAGATVQGDNNAGHATRDEAAAIFDALWTRAGGKNYRLSVWPERSLPIERDLIDLLAQAFHKKNGCLAYDPQQARLFSPFTARQVWQ